MSSMLNPIILTCLLDLWLYAMRSGESTDKYIGIFKIELNSMQETLYDCITVIQDNRNV